MQAHVALKVSEQGFSDSLRVMCQARPTTSHARRVANTGAWTEKLRVNGAAAELVRSSRVARRNNRPRPKILFAPSRLTVTVWVLLGTALAGCSYVNEEGIFGVQPDGLSFIRSDPPAGKTDVALDQPIDVYFDRPLASDNIGPADVQLSSGRVGIIGSYKVDLLRQRLRYRADGPLRADLQYRLLISSRLRGLDGARLQRSIIINFTTGRDRRRSANEEPRPITATELQPVWEANGCAACHRTGDAAAGVDLSAPDEVIRTLRNVSSLGSPLPRVAPGDHARSYLMRKLLGASGISGFRMPPDGRALSPDDLQQVADWIDTGAND
jgi:hypothetical protein